MRIAQIAPLYESVPPHTYGGTERVVHCLTEELVRRGHEVTLFASGDSVTSATLVPIIDKAFRLNPAILDPMAHVMREVGAIARLADDFDIIHSHIDYFAMPIISLIDTPLVSTLHGRLDLPDLAAIIADYPDAPLISISDSQRRPLPKANWLATVYNGIDVSDAKFSPKGGDYLAFLGRISPEKRCDWAIEIAKRVGMKLRIAAKVDPADRVYFEREIQPLLDHPLVEFIGEISQAEKSDFLGNAYASLFPIDWPEPFGLVMIESLATGTPVIARPRGSVLEVMRDGVTGYVRDTLDEMAAAVRAIDRIDRAACRRHVEQRFSAQIMADGYERAYHRLIAARHPRPIYVTRAMGGFPVHTPQAQSYAQVDSDIDYQGKAN